MAAQAGIRWHAIGPVQPKNAKYVAKAAHVFHALERLDRRREVEHREPLHLPVHREHRRPRLVALVLGLPDTVFFRVSRAMLAVDPAAKTSTLQDLERGRLTEVDELNGAIAALASAHGTRAPINELITRGVHELEQHLGTGEPLPYWRPDTLTARVASAVRSDR